MARWPHGRKTTPTWKVKSESENKRHKSQGGRTDEKQLQPKKVARWLLGRNTSEK